MGEIWYKKSPRDPVHPI